MAVRTRRQDAEVLYADEPLPLVSAGDLAQLTDGARRTPRQRMRLCVHPGVDSPLHEMFIASRGGAYIRPHKHLGKAESLLLLEGTADLVLFSDEGEVTGVVPLGDYGSGRPFYYRIEDARYHTLVVRSETVLYHEATSGPWDRARTVPAPWSPTDEDAAGQAALLSRVEREIEAWSSRRASRT
jgi:cupin fold WbuC family metalloprotein